MATHSNPVFCRKYFYETSITCQLVKLWTKSNIEFSYFDKILPIFKSSKTGTLFVGVYLSGNYFLKSMIKFEVKCKLQIHVVVSKRFIHGINIFLIFICSAMLPSLNFLTPFRFIRLKSMKHGTQLLEILAF